MNIDSDKSINPKDLPEENVFQQKEIYQFPQPADTGKPLKPKNKTSKPSTTKKEQNKSSKEEGLNEASSKGNAGAFEGFEDQGTD